MKTHVSLEQWQALIAVVDHGGYARAAEHLNKSQSAISHALKKLESSLGITVLAIQGRKAQLTPAGQALYQRAKILVEEALQIEALAQQFNVAEAQHHALNLQIEQTNSRAAGVSGNNIEIFGVVRNVEFFVDKDLKFCEDFFVIDNMTIPVNLGSNWLNKNEVKTIFTEEGNRIEVGNRSVNLIGKRKIVVKNLVQTVLDKEIKASTFQPQINVANLQDQKWKCSTKERMVVPPLSTVTVEIEIKSKLPEGQLCYIAPRRGYCSRNNLLINEGITEVGKNGRIVTKITNFEVYNKSIPAGTLVGNLFLAEAVTTFMLYGAVLILLGVALTTGVFSKLRS